MIIFFFNNYFPDNFGFTKRCKNEIDILSKDYEVSIVCRLREKNKISKYNSPHKTINVSGFSASQDLMDFSGKYKKIVYEIKRNFELIINSFFALTKEINRIKKNNPSEEISIYAVNSPLTIPLVSYISSLLTRAKLFVIEFHDLEPEMAVHIKNLTENSLILKIEYFLEKFLVNKFQKVITTTESQARILSLRTDFPISNICVIPNTVKKQIPRNINRNEVRQTLGLENNDFVVGYISTFSFRFTTSGLLKILESINHYDDELMNVKFLLYGNGYSFDLIKEKIISLKLEEKVILISGKTELQRVLDSIDVGLIPWERDKMTTTMLPTKLFDYISNGIPVLAPKFGELKKSIVKGGFGETYSSERTLFKIIQSLKTNRKLISKYKNNALSAYKNLYNNGNFTRELVNFIKK